MAQGGQKSSLPTLASKFSEQRFLGHPMSFDAQKQQLTEILHSQPHWHLEFPSNDSVRQDDRRVDDLHDDDPSLGDRRPRVQRVSEKATCRGNQSDKAGSSWAVPSKVYA